MQQFAQHSLKPEDAEQYQQKALSQWLPNVLGDKGSAEYRAARGLAELFAEHQDFWWRDLLRAEEAAEPATIAELSDAIQNNERGRHDQALFQARHAGLVFRRMGNVPAEMLAGFAEVYALRSKLQGASCLARATPILDKVSAASYRWLQAQLLLEKAQCRNFQVELAEADHDSVSSMTTATKFDFPVQRLRVIGIAAGMKHQQGRCDESWKLAVSGLGAYWQGTYPPERLDQFYAVMWQCARETGALYLAETLLRHTLALRENPNSSMQRNSIREGMLHLRLANILSALKETDSADSENRKASAALIGTDQRYAQDYVLRTRIEPAEMQLQHGDAELALATLRPVEQLLSSIQDKLIVLSYYRSLGNVHWELRHLDEASGAYRAGIDLAESSLASLKEGADRLAWLRAADDCYRGLVRVMLQQNQAEQALDRWEWYQSRPLLQGLHTGSTPSQELLRKSPKKKSGATTASPQHTRLVYASFKDGVQIWISNRKGVAGSWINVKQQDFERTVREFVESCANPDSSLNDIHELGTWLYLKLLQPVMPYLSEGEPISVELDRFVYNLPVEALLSPSGWYFGEKYPVVYSPGATSEESLRNHGPITHQTPILILDASHAPNSGFLPGIEAQKKAIAALFPRAQILDSTGVTWSEFGRRLAGSTVFHYMGHGRPDGSGTALMFSLDRTLSARDLASGPFRGTELAVLAACSTNKGQENGLWDSNNLVHALLSAGVPQIVASHWNVDSETTSKLMISFYRNLKSGMKVEQAAYDARKEIRAGMAHPYYWAGFSVTGSVD